MPKCESLLEAVARGVPITNSLLGLRIASAHDGAWNPPPAGSSDDEQFGRVFASQIRLNASAPWKESIAGAREFVPYTPIAQACETAIVDIADAEEADLLARAESAFEFVPTKLKFPELPEQYVYAKMGHGYWEFLVLKALHQAGKDYFRPLARVPLYEASCFDDVLTHALAPLAGRIIDSGARSANLVRPEFAFGLSFGSGDFPNSETAVSPLGAYVRGGIVGSLGYFGALFPGSKVVVGDRSFAKELFWDGELPAFFDEVQRWSDSVVFIVPPHLRGIRIAGWSGEQHCCVIPEKVVNELWPVVLPYCAGRLAPLFESGRRVSVFIQAACASVPISLLISEMARASPHARVRSFDFGQVLDVAIHPCVSYPWIKRHDILKLLALADTIPLVVN